MIHKINKVKLRIFLIIFIQVLILLALSFVWDLSIIAGLVIMIVEAILIYYVFYYINIEQAKHGESMLGLLDDGAKDALMFGDVGIVAYDDAYIVTWMSDLFVSRNIDRIGKKVLVWLPEVSNLISGQEELVHVVLDERKYEIRRRENYPMLFFKDVTSKEEYKRSYEEEKVVVGMINLDNYDESTRYEEESVVSNINGSLRTAIVDYAKEFKMILKRINNYRYLLVLNEKIFNNLMNDHFSILNKVRKAANQLEVSITLSMAFARGYDNYEELDENVIKLMDLAQNRGGDQVAIGTRGEDVKYFGGSSEATEKRSRVRVRIIAHALRDLIQKSSNVIICMHKDADFDCMGCAIGMSRIVSAYNKPVSIIGKTGGIEGKLKETLDRYKDDLKDRISLVSENEAGNQLWDDTLVLMVDHHMVKQSNGASILEKAKKVVIIDHHRRSADLIIKPTLIYIEAGASSTCELVAEFIPYLSNRIDISDIEANIMLAGMTIDTNHFKVRTGSRTYEAASYLRGLGADPIQVDEFIKDTLDEFELKSSIMAKMENYGHGIVIAAKEDGLVPRAIISQVGDSLLAIKNIEAAFIVAKTSSDEVAISARSNGNVNVQVIMEAMKGGGHMTAAGVQRKDEKVVDLVGELKSKIDEYVSEKEAEKNEGNLA